MSDTSNYELVTSLHAGYCQNATISADSIKITPVDEPGVLELYCRNKTLKSPLREETDVVTEYELRWKSTRDQSPSETIVLPFANDHELVRYSEVQSSVILVFRLKEAHKDKRPFFFWYQEAEEIAFSHFMTVIDLSQKKMQATDELIKKNEAEAPMNLVKFIRDRKVDSILENDEVCQRLYSLVPEKFRSKEALKRIVKSPSFTKNITMFQQYMNEFGYSVIASMYNVEVLGDAESNQGPDYGVRTYIRKIEEWAKKELDKKKEE